MERLAKEGKNDLPSAVSALAKRASVAALLTEGMFGMGRTRSTRGTCSVSTRRP